MAEAAEGLAQILLVIRERVSEAAREAARQGIAAGMMNESEVGEPGLIRRPELDIPADAVITALEAGGWRGGVGDLEPVELEAFWREALVYARWEIGQYGRWRGQDEPVLADGYDAEGIVQGAFARLLSRETGDVPIFYTAEGIREELRTQVKRRVRWLHERKETGLVTGEWDVLPARSDGELVSIFDYLPGRIARPDEEAIEREEAKLLGEFKAGFEETLGTREPLADVFRAAWAGEKRREMAERLGLGVERIKGLQREVNRRLAKFAARARGGVAEMLGSFREY